MWPTAQSLAILCQTGPSPSASAPLLRSWRWLDSQSYSLFSQLHFLCLWSPGTLLSLPLATQNPISHSYWLLQRNAGTYRRPDTASPCLLQSESTAMPVSPHGHPPRGRGYSCLTAEWTDVERTAARGPRRGRLHYWRALALRAGWGKAGEGMHADGREKRNGGLCPTSGGDSTLIARFAYSLVIHLKKVVF